MFSGMEFMGQNAGSFFYTVFNGLGMLAAFITMIIFTFKRNKRLYIDTKGQNLKKERRKSFLQAMLCFAVSYGALYLGTTLLGKIKFPSGQSTTMVFVGGVLLFIPVFSFMAYHCPRNGDVLSQLENVLPVLALTHVFNRLACLSSGCCHGITFKLGIVFPPEAPSSELFGEGTRVFPTQPLESVMMLACFILILVMMKKGKRTLYVFPLFFGITGFINEFFIDVNCASKGRMLLTYFDVPQIAYLILIAVGVLFYFLVRRKEKAIRVDGVRSVKIKA